jgi:hypothetical protein
MGDPDLGVVLWDEDCREPIESVVFTITQDSTGAEMLVMVPTCADHEPSISEWLQDISTGDGWSTEPSVLDDDALLEEIKQSVGLSICTHGRSTW